MGRGSGGPKPGCSSVGAGTAIPQPSTPKHCPNSGRRLGASRESPRPGQPDRGAQGGYLVDPASSHMLVSKIKPCMSKYELLIL